MDLHVLESGTQCFPRWLYEADGRRKDGITDATLIAFQTHYGNQTISKDQIFNLYLRHPAQPGLSATMGAQSDQRAPAHSLCRQF